MSDALRSSPSQGGTAPALGSLIRLTLRMSGCVSDLLEGLLGGDGVEVDDADRVAAGVLAADVHLGDVHLVPAEASCR